MMEGFEPGLEPGKELPGEAPPPSDRERSLQEENRKLREERRNDRADALVSRLKLPDSMKSVLSLVPIDQMDERAKAIAEEIAASAAPPPAPPATGGEPQSPAPAEPPAQPPAEPGTPPVESPDVAALRRMTQGGEGTGPSPAAKSGEEQLLERLNGVKSMHELEQIQREMREAARRK